MSDRIEDMSADELRAIGNKLWSIACGSLPGEEAVSMANRCWEVADLLDAAKASMVRSIPLYRADRAPEEDLEP